MLCRYVFSIKVFFSTCDKIRSLLRIWSHLLKKSVMENFIFSAVCVSLADTYLIIYSVAFVLIFLGSVFVSCI